MRRLHSFWIGFWLGVLALLAQGSAVAQEENAFSEGQLDQLVAPIALYPDSLVAQLLMASTYPLEIVQAARWREQNPDLEGEELEQALASENWDPSVKALTNFSEVLQRMSDNLDWTQDLGDAVLAQEAEVMAAIQRMRQRAHDAGNLETTTEQEVVVEQQIIRVEPATEVVYVPAYSPTVVYGSAWAPSTYYYPFYGYPRSYWYPPGYVASNVISFGVGMAVGAAIWRNWNWGYVNWRGRSININNNFNFSRNINTANLNIGNRVGGDRYSKWQHNVNHRGGVRYRDASTKARFDAKRAEVGRQPRIDRDAARGFDRSAARSGDRLASRTGDRAGDRATRRDRSGDRLASRTGERAGDRAATRDQARQRDLGADRLASRSGDRAASRDFDRQRPSVSRDSAASSRQARDVSRSTRSGTRSSAFNPSSRSMARASSSRGASSLAGSRTARSGGGGGRVGGGGLRR